ncbi:hypothetical protein BDR03DRAFT_1008877 [Suillus americanus]|nr:hypothetical protein BDR03DRAFT_1008877 [Suillus americanus]
MSNSTAGDLAKLTVPQLKVLCKERRIVGYSKLGKAALLQKLTNRDNNAARGDPQPRPAISIQPISKTTSPGHTGHPAGLSPARPTGVTTLNHTCNTQTADQDLTATSAEQFLRKALPVSGPVDHLAANHHASPTVVAASSPDAPNENQSTKRPRVSAMFESAKRQKPSPVNTASICDATSSSDSTESPTATGTLKACAGLTFVTDSPAAAGHLPHGSSASASSNVVPIIAQPRNINLVQKASTTKLQGRFKPLVFTTTPLVAGTSVTSQRVSYNDHRTDEITFTSPDTFSLEVVPISIPSLKNITLPPKLSDKKRAQSWAVILAALTDQDRQTCTLVSRTFRYADPLSARLWASPDDEKQVAVALRFILTRLWFTLSVGTNRRDPSAWLKHTVEDAQEVVKGEIWTITIRDGNSLSEFYVLESTCEVIGRALNAQLEVYSPGLRADWSRYLSSHAGVSAGPRNLISENLRWADYEEYDRGISRHWLLRISAEGDVGLLKKVVAERYVLACVVANSISGQWMSSNQMAQEFAGLPSQGTTLAAIRGGAPKINLYLPAHHHIESVHFTTPKGVQLHPALAVIQTPAREYIVLKDNGMQVGCEEDGVANVWMHVLGCDKNGIAVVRSK